jgi:hypothetical protein
MGEAAMASGEAAVVDSNVVARIVSIEPIETT